MAFPPSSPTSVANIIPSYLYVEYNDDDTLQAFVDAQNTLQQEYLDWFNTINLPIYTGPLIVDDLLDWVAQGIYGLTRPTLKSGKSVDYGPYNTVTFNSLPFNTLKTVGAVSYLYVSDDIFKRIITWSFYKGDGFQFSIPWLKRRIQRFLNGTNGTDQGTDNTYPVSVTFGAGDTVTINISAASANPAAQILQEAVRRSAIPLPFQYTFTVVV